MKNLHFTYDMHIEYSIPVSDCHFTIKCLPQNTLRQTISNINIQMIPETKYSEGFDGLKNAQLYGVNEKPHTTFDFHIDGDAVTGLCSYECEASDEYMIFSYPHGLNKAGERIKSFFDSIKIPYSDSNMDRAIVIMNSLYGSFTYKPFVTDVNTSAEQAFSKGSGVCQDYAHIFISLLHLASIPARYVTGFLIGEGASHAWVEIYESGKWYGLDPTNNCVVTDNHIKIGIGRDAKDCMINRGIMHGGGLHTQTVKVLVTEFEQ